MAKQHLKYNHKHAMYELLNFDNEVIVLVDCYGVVYTYNVIADILAPTHISMWELLEVSIVIDLLNWTTS